MGDLVLPGTYHVFDITMKAVTIWCLIIIEKYFQKDRIQGGVPGKVYKTLTKSDEMIGNNTTDFDITGIFPVLQEAEEMVSSILQSLEGKRGEMHFSEAARGGLDGLLGC